jgi:RimJ/RimL family protein N-acetyltransferase
LPYTIGGKQQRNKGYGKAIINELVRFAFEDLNFHRLDLAVYDFNQQAIKCYKDCGFEIEGLFIDNKKVGANYWSTYNMSIINKN